MHTHLTHADGDGRLTGTDAVSFFQLSNLPRETLAKVWTLSDTQRRGFLDFQAFCRAMDLIALAQSTGDVSLDAYSQAKQAGTLGTPRMQGLERFVNPPLEPDPATNPYAAIPEPTPPPQPTPLPPVDTKPWSTKKAVKPLSTKDVTSIVDGLKKIYFNKVRHEMTRSTRMCAYIHTLLS